MTKTEALEALEAAATAAARAEQARDDAAREAHAAGASWADIAGKLGISKQRAHQRYSGPARDRSRDHQYTPAECAEADKALSALQAIAARQDAEEASKILATDVAGESVTPSIFLEPKAPAKAAKRPTEKQVLDRYAAKRARKAGMPDLCPGCGKRWHGQEHWDGRPTAFTDCTETQNDHEWTQDWPAQANTTYAERKASK